MSLRDNQGHISVEELKFVMRHLEEKMTEEELEELVREADHDNDGQISYDEFAFMMCLHKVDPEKLAL